MLKSVDENRPIDDESSLDIFRNRILSRSSIETEGVIFKQHNRRKSSNLSVYIQDDHVDNLPSDNTIETNRPGAGEKLYKTYAEFYLKTKRSGSLAVPVNAYTRNQRKELRTAFDLLDIDNDSYLSENDMKQIYDTLDPTMSDKSKIDALIKEATCEENESINFDQFADFFGGTYFGRFTRSELLAVFNLFDKDQDLEIGSNDLEMLFEPVGWNNKVDVDRILKAMDLNKDGRVCFEDFKAVMNNYK